MDLVISSSLALLDSGASAYGFIDSNFAQKQKLDLIKLSKPRTLKVFDGSNSSAGQITHIAKTVLDIDGHIESILLFVTSLAFFDLVLAQMVRC